MRILVADDDATCRFVVEAMLRRLGHEWLTVVDGNLAWEAFCAYRPDVIISDWMMPGLTGLELCTKIRADSPHRYAYFIMVTSHGATANILEGMTAGADDCLVKPLDANDLAARLIAAARITSLHRELASQRDQLEGLNVELAAIARRDSLTGLGNRMALQEDLDLLQARAVRYGHRYCMALLDVDNFKSYNDSRGHQEGDEALRAVASQILGKARKGDSVYRYGGDEFLCIFPEQSLHSGTIAVERMRTALEQLAIPHVGNRAGVLTFSAGLAVLGGGHAKTVSEVIREADRALYQAKKGGRNRVELLDPQLA